MVADRARAAGLDVRWGRKVLELRPPVDGGQGDRGARAARRARACAAALYAGDDTTDLDGFRGLDALRAGRP